MNIDDLTLGQIKELQAAAPQNKKKEETFPFKVGDCVFIRTVAHHQTGRIAAIGRDWIKLEDAAWIADSGRFSTALATGTLSEVEAIPSWCLVGRGSIVDMFPWSHPLPRITK